MKHALYKCRKVQVIYFSKVACTDVSILPPCFPRPMISPSSVRCDAVYPDIQHHKIFPPANKHFFFPKTPPSPPTNENIKKLKKWQLNQFATTAFNNSRKFPVMFGPLAHIHLKEGSTPKAKHSPIPLLYHQQRRDFINIGAFHYAHVVKSIL